MAAGATTRTSLTSGTDQALATGKLYQREVHARCDNSGNASAQTVSLIVSYRTVDAGERFELIDTGSFDVEAGDVAPFPGELIPQGAFDVRATWTGGTGTSGGWVVDLTETELAG